MRHVRGANGKAEETERDSTGGAELSYEDALGFAVCSLKMSVHDFEWLLPVEFAACVKQWQKNEEQKMRFKYELERFNSYLNLSPNLKPNTKQEDIVRFDWEKLQIAKVKYG